MEMDLILRRVLIVFFGVTAALLTGCAQIKLGPPVATIDNIQKAKATGMAPAAVGDFALAAGRPRAMDEGLGIRSNTISSPFQSSFAQYLKETLTVELKGAGLLDPGSKVVVQGWLTDSQLDASMSQGQGSLAARFMVLRAGKSAYDKELQASATWESSFVGAIAIPAAVNQYSSLYRKLVAQLLDDPSFKAAVAP